MRKTYFIFRNFFPMSMKLKKKKKLEKEILPKFVVFIAIAIIMSKQKKAEINILNIISILYNFYSNQPYFELIL